MIRLALAPIDSIVGAFDDNLKRLRAARSMAAQQNADIVIAPELALVGYTPEDLVLKPAFLRAAEDALTKLAAETMDRGPAWIVGAPCCSEGKLFNAAFCLDNGRIQAWRGKQALPNYGVFDEMRLFASGRIADEPVALRGIRLNILICEDMWSLDVNLGFNADIVVVINGSPFNVGKAEERRAHARRHVAATRCPLIYVNRCGAQDELVFDGDSFAFDGYGVEVARLKTWSPDITCVSWDAHHPSHLYTDKPPAIMCEPIEDIYCALMTGLGGYVRKNGFPGVILGLSGGIDSALAAIIAVDALGPECVHAVALPSPYTSESSLEDASTLASCLAISYEIMPITPVMRVIDTVLNPSFSEYPPDHSEENIQARIRGLLLMAMSNKKGLMVIATSNKSELSTGYATLYGDMCGGFAPLKDVYKTDIYKLADWRNTHHPHGALGPEGGVIPQNILDKPPSAELRPDQRDSDSLPPYDRLDALLHDFIDKDLSPSDIRDRGRDQDEADHVHRLIDRAEYKRRQAPPGVRISKHLFVRERRYPLTQAFHPSPSSGPSFRPIIPDEA